MDPMTNEPNDTDRNGANDTERNGAKMNVPLAYLSSGPIPLMLGLTPLANNIFASWKFPDCMA